MVDVAMVRMFGIPVGTFRWDGQYEIVRFEYDRNFVGRGLEPSPLMMPVRVLIMSTCNVGMVTVATR